jgi:AraC-like DNA-binding protein
MRERSDDAVRVWRPADQERLLLMRGRTSSYAVDPRGEYCIGVIAAEPMRVTRGRARHVVRPGELVAWDPSLAHAGAPADRRPWHGSLLVIELPRLEAVLADEDDAIAGLAFPQPVIDDPPLAAGFLELHAALTSVTATLERDARLAEWLRALAARSSAPPRAQRAVRRARRDPALRAACELLASEPARNVTLDELAAAAGVGRYRLLRLLRAGLGVPPHRYQLACRISRARTLLAAGRPIADVALETGFADQSHLHRHFRRSLGLTPAGYAAAVARAQTPSA